MRRWDDTTLTVPKEQFPFGETELRGLIEWYVSSHLGHYPMVIRLPLLQYISAMPCLIDNCDKWYGVPVLPESGFQQEDERELEWVP